MAFRRLTYHRSYFMIGVGVLGLAGALGYGIGGPGDDLTNQIGWSAVVAAFALLFLVRGLTGEWGQRQLRVDVAAGKLRLNNGDTYALDELGELTIERQPLPRRRMTDTQVEEYRLRAANVKKYYVYFSLYESDTLLRKRILEEVILQSRLRKILERPTSDGSAFRSGPDALPEVRAIESDTARTIAALDALAKKDPDAHVRTQAKNLVTSLRAG